MPMKETSIAEILELPVQERIDLVELIWDSISAIPNTVSVSDESGISSTRDCMSYEPFLVRRFHGSKSTR